MRVLIVLPNDSLGGAEQYLKMIATAMQSQNTIEVFFLKKRHANSWKVYAESVQFNFPTTTNPILNLIQLGWKLRSSSVKYDIIFTSHVYITGVLGILRRLRLLKTVHFVGRESTSIFKRFSGFKLLTYKLFYRFGYKAVDLLICQTQFMKSQLLSGMPRIQRFTRVEVIHNPIDLDLIKSKSNQNVAPLTSNRYIVSAGRFIPEKGFDILIDSFYKLQKEFPDLHLLILGEGQLRESMENQISKLGITTKVHLPGFVDNVYPYFKNAEVCVVSSRVEGFPNVLLQMMSQNQKVVSTTCAGGIEDIPGIFISETENCEKLYSAIKDSLIKNTQDRISTFMKYLKQRDIHSFLNQVNTYLSNET